MTKDKILRLRMDKKLREQLQRYADRNDEGIASVSARRALKMFLEENKEYYKCSICGFSETNRSTWCDLGCGSDYNEMIEVKK